MECLARTIEHDETDAVPRLAAYVRISHADLTGITAETTEEKFKELVTAAAKTYPIVTIKPHSSLSSSWTSMHTRKSMQKQRFFAI